jgi:hypothetical protein
MGGEDERRMAVRQLWLEQFSPERRTGNDVFRFYGWLYANRPELLPVTRAGADAYQALKSDLSGLWQD